VNLKHPNIRIPTKLYSAFIIIKKNIPVFIIAGILILVSIFAYARIQNQNQELANKNIELQEKIKKIDNELVEIKSEDQFVKNEKLQEEIENIEKTYQEAVIKYEELINVKDKGGNTDKADELFAEALSLLSERNFSSASAVIKELSEELETQDEKTSSTFSIPANVAENNTPPSSGYSRQQVSTEIGSFLVDIVSSDLNSTRVIVDTASDSDCSNECPVLPLADYVSRSGGFAGVNGSYFCPASYPSCQGKTNTFDTLLMNKNKTYFNSDNNVYSTVPVAVFGSGWSRFIGRSLDWGRDTGVDGVIANQPLLLSGGNIAFGEDGDPKKGSRGSRSFVGVNGNTIYIGVVHNATVAEVAYALKQLGLSEALNLDSGGSTALWSGGYRVGPGRNIPNAIVFVRK